MEIRIIKSQKGTRYLPLGKDQFLSISDGTKKLGDFLSKRLERYDSTNNQREEIVPEIDKYQLWDIRVLQVPEGYCYFTGCSMMEKNQVKVELYRYQLETKQAELLYENKETLSMICSQKKTVLFLLNENYLLIQHMYVRSNEMETYSGFLDFELILYNIKEKKSFPVTDLWLSQSGIEQIQMITKNICAIKTGVNLLEENRYQFLSEKEVFPERIGFFNIQQMISDILLKQKTIYMDVLEETRWDKTLFQMRAEDGVLMYSRFYLKEKREEAVFYHYTEKTMEISYHKGVMKAEEVADSCVIEGTPYIRQRTEEGISFYNVRKKSWDISFGEEQRIVAMAHGIIVLEERKKKGFFRSEKHFCEIYRLPEKERVLREKAEVECAMIPDRESVYLFTK